MQSHKDKVTVRYTMQAPKKNSVRLKTAERLSQEFNLSDQYVNRAVLELLGLSPSEQNDPTLAIDITYELARQ